MSLDSQIHETLQTTLHSRMSFLTNFYILVDTINLLVENKRTAMGLKKNIWKIKNDY